MNEKQFELSKLWIKKARNDLITAKQSLKLDESPNDTICFHSQQAVEKLLKSIAVYYNISFPKIHDLVYLFDLLEDKANYLISYKEHISKMTEYAVGIRYPEADTEPSRIEAQDAFNTAVIIYNLVVMHLNLSDSTLFK